MKYLLYFWSTFILFSCGTTQIIDVNNPEKIQTLQDSIQKVYTDSLSKYQDNTLHIFLSNFTSPVFAKSYGYNRFVSEIKDCATQDFFEIENLSFEYLSDCPKKGPFGSELKLNGQIINKNMVKDLMNPDKDYSYTPNPSAPFDRWKLYEVNNRKYLSLIFGIKGCVGTGCMFDVILLYDFSRKQIYITTGHILTAKQGNFGDFNKDGKLDYIDVEYSGKGNIHTADTVTLTLYTQTKFGHFEKFLDENQKSIFVKAKFEGNIFKPRNLKVIENNWKLD